MDKKRDQLFLSRDGTTPFAFDSQVAEVFDDMAHRSIPFYAETLRTLTEWVPLFYQRDSWILDIGCSTGNALLALAKTLPPGSRFLGIDPSMEMLTIAKEKLTPFYQIHEIKLNNIAAQDFTIKDASIVIADYTLQFIPMEDRISVLSNIHGSLRPGGLFFFSEKICFSSQTVQSNIDSIYENFKIRQGYSQEEIENKKKSLSSILIPMEINNIMMILKEAGFKEATTILQWHNFVTFIAIK